LAQGIATLAQDLRYNETSAQMRDICAPRRHQVPCIEFPAAARRLQFYASSHEPKHGERDVEHLRRG